MTDRDYATCLTCGLAHSRLSGSNNFLCYDTQLFYMSENQAATSRWWSWQWTATFAVMFGYSIGAMLWTSGFQTPAVLVGIVATLLGMYVISSG